MVQNHQKSQYKIPFTESYRKKAVDGMKPSMICQKVKKDQIVLVDTKNGQWALVKEQKPMGHFIELYHRHLSSNYFHKQYKSEWITPSGIVEMINYIR